MTTSQAREDGREADPGVLRSGRGTRPGPTTRVRVREVSGTSARDRRDDLATEEPLEIRIAAGGRTRTLAVTMRTPGADFELAAGFLAAEGIVHPDPRHTATSAAIASIAYCTDEDLPPEARYNTVTVRLDSPVLPDLPNMHRHFMTSSACGVCGTASLDALRARQAALPPTTPASFPPIPAEILYDLPRRLRKAQGIFGKTGGLHAAGLFTPDGSLLALREDVGRHNAVDKLIGWALLSGRLPLTSSVLMVSGRTSYEIMQKALAAGLPMVCGVSAPSSLAVALAHDFDLTLIGFLREERFNIYTAPDRVQLPSPG
ncbi:sulfurtransferase FdhD [Sphaerisporangium krabiense]|uniref:Sulfur carrier protein FdhD n=1 Tax=Sphaerisporangium krabiense TaxID=763782 RepID=A0A7W9DMU9_9ACTN|nr:formate dehydrogenase accessory sulfurtransferase FdhD [Sphaerisporangium krabiense]MBB5624727.1 FdhD protein [Sphaerisporangium krabiense]GII61312.1 sulfurtransferase FdhD [Sphaerisporangium krabiense]